MSEAVQRFSEKVPVRFTRHGESRKVHLLNLEIAELAECKTRREAKRLAQREAHAALRKKYGSKYCLKKASLLEIATG